MSISDPIWDIADPISFQPSVLHHLAPHGVGTPYMESLTSYLKRLAQIHHLRVVDLISFCAAQSEHDVMPSTTQKLARIDGITQSAAQWAPLLRKLTQHPHVAYLTLFYWHTLFHPHRALRQHHAWCARCFEDWAAHDQPVYEPLLWRLQLVTHCSVHACPLTETCPYCHKQFVSLSNNTMIGFCPKCAAWLGEKAAGAAVDASYSHEPDIQTLETLLALTPQVTRFDANLALQVIEFVKQRRQVPYSHLQRILGISTSHMQSLKVKEQLPGLLLFLKIAQLPDGGLFAHLIGQANEYASDVDCLQDSLTTPDAHKYYLESLCASTEPLPGLQYIAKQCGYPTITHLQKAFPDLYDTLEQRLHQEQCQQLKDVLNGDAILSLHRLACQMKYNVDHLRRTFPELCKQVREVYPQRQHEHCRRHLAAILADDVFPSLTQIAHQLGIGTHYLRRRFPTELQRIKEKRQKQVAQTRKAAQATLTSALQADLPTSLQQIATTLNVTTKYLKKYFPAQAQQVLDRYRCHQKERVQYKCDLIRQTVFDLHAQGVYPSVDRIHAVLGSWMVHGKIYRNTYQDALTNCGYLRNS
jgi:hypothetical protein